MRSPDVATIATTTHGRYLVASPDTPPAGLLVGFHGYAETAEIHLDALRAIRGTDRWVTVAVQGLHPFYTRDQRIVANWMTRQDRDLAIADNIAYVQAVLERVATTHGAGGPRVFIGFSQGGAMAFRAAAHCGADGLIVLAADVPPDVAAHPDLRLPLVLLGRGRTDPWYSAEAHAADVAILERHGVSVRSCVFDGGHDWGAEFREAVTAYLEQVSSRSS